MSNKLTDKQEAFVQALLMPDTSQRDAYKIAYNADKMKDSTIDNKASLLLKKEKVGVRYDELKGKVVAKAEELGLFKATDVLKKIHDIVIANELEDPKTALKGLELYGKHLKLFTDKVETVNHNINEDVTKLSTEDRRAKIKYYLNKNKNG